MKEEDFISLGKLIRKLSNVRNCRAITTEIRKVLPNKMSNYLPTEHQLNKLRTDIKGFTIGENKGPVWRANDHRPEEHNALIKAAVANTEFETKEEHKTKGWKKKDKTVDMKLEVRKVTNKVRELKNIPMYGAKIKGDFKSLLLHQRLRHLKFNINYDDDC